MAHRTLIAAVTKRWGSWRCNALAFAGTVTAARYVASLELEERKPVLESAFFVALVNQGLGTISGEHCAACFIIVVIDVVLCQCFRRSWLAVHRVHGVVEVIAFALTPGGFGGGGGSDDGCHIAIVTEY